MSLDFSLSAMRRTDVFSRNITHNLNNMADAAGLYYVLWRPEEIGVKTAAEAIPILRTGIAKLVDQKEQMLQYNPKNGWGDYDGLLEFARAVLHACEDNPDATIDVRR
jgi:hypothetical protein